MYRQFYGTADEHGQQLGPGDRGLLGRLAGGARVGDGGRDGSVHQLCRTLRPSVEQIAQLFNSIQSALAGAERVFDLMDQMPEMDAPEAKALEHVNGEVAFEDVDFSYEAGVPVLKDVSLQASPGR